MPTLNQRLLLRIILLTLLFGGGVFFLHYIQSDRSVEALRWQAENATANGKIDKAIMFMGQYLEFRPNDHEATVKLADLILKRAKGPKELANAMFLLEKVARESPDREEVRRKLVNLCLRMNRHSDALIHLQPLLQNYPQEPELWEQQGICQTVQNKHEAARKSLETAIHYDPSRISSYELLAQLLILQMNLPTEGQTWIEKMVEANPKDPIAYLIRARYLRSVNKMDDSLRDVDHVILLDPLKDRKSVV